VEDFKDLVAWRKAHQLTLAVYKQTRAFPKEEIYGLTSQVRRASASIGRCEHRGRVWPAIGCGNEEISSDCSRFCE
jgi:hypothetical protein